MQSFTVPTRVEWKKPPTDIPDPPQHVVPTQPVGTLSKEALELIEQWNKVQTNTKPSWDEYFIGLAFHVSERSNDGQTKHGCVLTSQTHEPIATGYNGHMRNVEDNILPVLRPDKYPWMIHAEHNAVLSCARQGKSTLNSIAYVTGEPCIYCYQYMWQAGIVQIVYGHNPTNMNDEEMDKKIEIFKYLTQHGLKIRHINISRKS